MSHFSELSIVPEPSAEILNQRQIVDYRSQREDCLEWLLTFGKNPDKAEGYAFQTVRNRASRMDAFYRWVWEYEGRYTTSLTHEHGDKWLRHLARGDESNAHKDNCRKAAQMLFKWRQYEHGLDEWEPSLSFSTGSGTTTPRDYLTETERGKIREAALEYGAIPAYNDLSPTQRSRWKAYLAQRFQKPKAEVTPDDWDRANGWKIPSLVWVSLDAGFRPIEVERAVVQWVDIDNSVLRIPKEDSSKNEANWIVSLQDRTAEMLARWLEERETRLAYDETDQLWLTRERNPYQSSALRYVLNRLCEIADIDTERRSLSWYSLRHSTGTYMTREEDLAAAQTQLRHKSPETTMKYDQVPIEDRRDALNRMG
jgi:site-specific recombinase XerD